MRVSVAMFEDPDTGNFWWTDGRNWWWEDPPLFDYGAEPEEHPHLSASRAMFKTAPADLYDNRIEVRRPPTSAASKDDDEKDEAEAAKDEADVKSVNANQK